MRGELETVWTWRWRCPKCGEVFRGEGDKKAMLASAAVIRFHQEEERRIDDTMARLVESQRIG